VGERFSTSEKIRNWTKPHPRQRTEAATKRLLPSTAHKTVVFSQRPQNSAVVKPFFSCQREVCFRTNRTNKKFGWLAPTLAKIQNQGFSRRSYEPLDRRGHPASAPLLLHAGKKNAEPNRTNALTPAALVNRVAGTPPSCRPLQDVDRWRSTERHSPPHLAEKCMSVQVFVPFVVCCGNQKKESL
jgi:hypothetical protein